MNITMDAAGCDVHDAHPSIYQFIRMDRSNVKNYLCMKVRAPVMNQVIRGGPHQRPLCGASSYSRTGVTGKDYLLLLHLRIYCVVTTEIATPEGRLPLR